MKHSLAGDEFDRFEYCKGRFPGRYLDHVWDGVGTWLG